MREILTEIEIAAPPAKVWSILIDFNKWEDWNPISKASGSASQGSTLEVIMLGSDGKVQNTYKPVITSFKEPELFRWRAVMMAGFIFTNDKFIELTETDNGTKIIHKEEFRGLMVPMFWGNFKKYVGPMLNSMNTALKLKAETA